MKSLVLVLSVAFFCFGAVNWEKPKDSGETVKVHDSKGFAVVELFTSEGCSSCPAADDLLRKIKQEAEKSGNKVYTLAFHIDYWNYLGWTDEFSSPEYTQRQKAYSRKFGSGVYTPQMVINGRWEFVGSNSVKAHSNIEDELIRKPRVQVELDHILALKERDLEVNYKIEGQSEDSDLIFALVENRLERGIMRGENRGRTLKHESVVRLLQTVEIDQKSGQWKVKIPPEVKIANSGLIVLVQEKDNGEIIAASEIKHLSKKGL